MIASSGRHSGNTKFDSSWSPALVPIAAGLPAAPNLPGQPRVQNFPARTTIVEEGDHATGLCEIVSGGVLLIKMLPDGRRQIIEILGAGDVFGVSPTGVSDITAETLTPVKLVIHSKKAVDGDPELRSMIFARMRLQMCAMHDHALLLGRKSAEERLSTFLMRMMRGRGGYGCAGPQGASDSADIPIGMTRQEIADYLGLTIETVSRAFTSLRRAGVIAYTRNDAVTAPSVCALCQLSGSV